MLWQEPKLRSEKVLADLPLYVTRPDDDERRPGILLIQEIFGVNEHIQDVARRYAAMGYVVVAPDMFHRAGHWLAFGYDQMEQGRQVAGQMKEAEIVGDLKASLDYLASLPGVDSSRIGVVGFCMGGRLSYEVAVRFPDRVKAACIYYGGGIARPKLEDGTWPPAAVDRAGEIRCPVLGFFAEVDPHIPRETVERLDQKLEEHNVEHRIYFYPGAQHGFFCDARRHYHPRYAQDAWCKTQQFFVRHLGPVPSVQWR